MKKMTSGLLAIGCTAALLGGCQSIHKEDVGLAAGGVAGGVVGSSLTGGSTAGTVAGAVGGAFLGREVAKRVKN